MRALLALCLVVSLLHAGEKPNVIFILADDLGYGELGCYGQAQIQTPHLDQMGKEGARFTQFYAGSPVCAPSRSVLLTGLHAGHTRVRGNAGGRPAASQILQAEDVTIAQTLRQSGYATGVIGKWGLGSIRDAGDPNRQGFDEQFGFLNQTHAHNHFPDFLWKNGERIALPNDLTRVGSTEGTGYATKRAVYANDLFFEEARAFVDRNRARPFFLYLAITAPHANNERRDALGDGNEVPDYGPYEDRDWHPSVKGHAAMITRMDRQIGELLAHLRRAGLAEKTLVLFSSDNGAHREGGPNYDPAFFNASGPLRGLKRDLFEGGIRVPFLAWWPGRIPAGSVSRHVGSFADIAATLTELAGATPPAKSDGISFVPALLERTGQRTHEYLYWEFHEGGVSQAVLVKGRWKAIRARTGPAATQLYDLENDLGETRDVAGKHPGMVATAERFMREAHVDNEWWKLDSPANPAR